MASFLAEKEEVDAAFDSWWSKFGKRPEMADLALQETQKQIGARFPSDYEITKADGCTDVQKWVTDSWVEFDIKPVTEKGGRTATVHNTAEGEHSSMDLDMELQFFVPPMGFSFSVTLTPPNPQTILVPVTTTKIRVKAKGVPPEPIRFKYSDCDFLCC
jgi:hypothetical protein